MTLQKYLESRGMLPADLAAELGLYPSTLYRILSGQRGPSLELAFVIEQYTNGKVKAESFLPIDAEEMLKSYRDRRDKIGHGRRVRMNLKRLREAEAA
jgi:transcriptional regulator with XRE-family HTH domain